MRKHKRLADKKIRILILVGVVLATLIFISGTIWGAYAVWPKGKAWQGDVKSGTALLKPAKSKKVTAPYLKIDQPRSFDTNQSQLTITGKTVSGYILTVDGIKREVRTDGTFAFTVDLVKGINVVTVTAKDKKGGRIDREITINCLVGSTIQRDISTLPKAMLGHWRTPAGKYSIYVSDGSFIARRETDRKTVSGTYAIGSSDADNMVVSVYAMNQVYNTTIRFSTDRSRATIIDQYGREAAAFYIDDKTTP